MFFLIFILSFFHPQKADFINAVEKSYPFKIGRYFNNSDYILLQISGKILNGTSYSTTDSGSHNILFVQEY